MGKSYNRPYCTLSCNKTSGSCSSIFRKDENGVATNSYPYNTIETWLKNFNLKPADDIIIKKGTYGLQEGTVYTVRCCEVSDEATILRICKDNPITVSPKMTIVGPAARCERPFSAIMADLQNMRHTIITEESFRDWASKDERDTVSTSTQYLPSAKGSGDIENIKEEMDNLHYDYANEISIENFGSSVYVTKVAVSKIKELTDKGFPVVIGYYRFAEKGTDELIPPQDVFDSLNLDNFQEILNLLGLQWLLGGHSVVALNVEEIPFTSRRLITVLDSKEPSIEILDCAPAIFNVYSSSGPSEQVEIYLCENQGPRFEGKEFFYLTIGKQDILKAQQLINSYETFCAQNQQSSFCLSRKEGVNRWLEQNYPSLKNEGTTSSPMGICYGWNQFVISIAYLGEFTGFDWHPDDGNGIGYACDANRNIVDEHPISTKSSSWLANLSQLTKLIKLPGLIGWPVK